MATDEKKYYDPEYDRLVTEDVIKGQFNWFKENIAGFAKSYEQFRDDNFMDAKWYGRL